MRGKVAKALRKVRLDIEEGYFSDTRRKGKAVRHIEYGEDEDGKIIRTRDEWKTLYPTVNPLKNAKRKLKKVYKKVNGNLSMLTRDNYLRTGGDLSTGQRKEGEV